MGQIGTVLDIEPNVEDGDTTPDVKVDFGAEPITCPLLSSGIDAQPMVGDYVATTSHRGDVERTVVAFGDPSTPRKAASGEWRVYGRDASGAVVNEFWLKVDGSVVVNNDNGSIELGADGTVSVNGNLTVDP